MLTNIPIDKQTETIAPAVDDPEPWLRLAAAVLVQATKDAAAGDQGAANWLAGDGLALAQLLGVRAVYVTRWLAAGCVMPRIKPYRTRKREKTLP